MHVSTLIEILLAVVVAGWSALGWYAHRGARRRGGREAQWVATAADLSGLDAELDQVWAAEADRIGRLR